MPKLLDDVFVISRLGKLENRSTALTIGSINSIVKGPRPFFICNDEVAKNSVGCVAFNAAGVPLGVFVTKQNEGGEEPGMGMLMSMMMGGGGRSDQAAAVLRPSWDVLEVAAQAGEAAGDEDKEEGDKEEGVEDHDEDEDGDK